MSSYLCVENIHDRGPVYVREDGRLYEVNENASARVKKSAPNPRPSRLFSKGFSVELCMNRENDNGRTDHFIFTYTKEGNLRYSAKSLFSLVLSYVADNINHVDSLKGFPEQIAEKLFYAANARQKFAEPRTGLGALQKFTDAYGNLVLQTLCLKNSYLLISEKLEEIKSFQDLICLDLSCCKLGDDHDLLGHITSETLSRALGDGGFSCVMPVERSRQLLSSVLKCVQKAREDLTRVLLKDNCLSDAGLRKMTAPVRIMKRGLENLTVLDLSYNPGITSMGLRYLHCFKRLNYLDISGTDIKHTKAAICEIQTQMGLIPSEVYLKEFDHSSCKTQGWAEQTILQWEHEVLDKIKPEENLKSRTAAQRFYGKTRRTEEPFGSQLGEREKETSENLQFYRGSAEMSDFPLQNRKTKMAEELQNKKRTAVEQKGKRFQSKNFILSVADWDLLNSY